MINLFNNNIYLIFILSCPLSLRKIRKQIRNFTSYPSSVPAIPLIPSIYHSFCLKFIIPPHYEGSVWLLLPLFIDNLPISTMLLLKFIHKPHKNQLIPAQLRHLISLRYRASYKNIQTPSSFHYFKFSWL